MQMSEQLQGVFYLKAEEEPGFAIAYALMQLAHAAHSIAGAVGDLADCANRQIEATEKLAVATDRCATHLKYLGVGDAATTMGAIEYLTTATQDVANAIREAGEKIADADR
jgi:uncharacterized protein with PhoU and TrkA domain